MAPMLFTNLTQHSRPRTITLVIETSNDPRRKGEHAILPGNNFRVEPNESGRIMNWLRDQQVPFEHGDEDAWVISKRHALSVRNLRAFTRPEIKAVKRKSQTLEGLNVSFEPITKEQRK